jgi:hypothetical protein
MVEKVVKTGTYLYAGEVVCDLRIVYRPTRWGSGDHEDPPEIANDLDCDSYYVEYGGTTQRGAFVSGGGCFDTLEEAMRQAQQTVEDLTWLG